MYRKLVFVLFNFLLILINCCNSDKEIILLKSSQVGDFELVRNMLSQGAKVNCKDNTGNTPLIIAYQNNHIEILKLLLDNGADVSIKGSDNKSLTDLIRSYKTGGDSLLGISNKKKYVLIKSILEKHIQKLAFLKASKKNTIEAYCNFVILNLNDDFIDDAIDSIYYLMEKEFPSNQFETNIPKENLKDELLQAIEENRCLIITFAPKVVGFLQEWEINFIELAGKSVFISRMKPYLSYSINFSEKKYYVNMHEIQLQESYDDLFGSKKWKTYEKDENIQIKTFGKASTKFSLSSFGFIKDRSAFKLEYHGIDCNFNKIIINSYSELKL